MLEVQIFTLYPDLYPGLLDIGIYKKAQEKQKCLNHRYPFKTQNHSYE